MYEDATTKEFFSSHIDEHHCSSLGARKGIKIKCHAVHQSVSHRKSTDLTT